MRGLLVLVFASAARAQTLVLLGRGDCAEPWTAQGGAALAVTLGADTAPWSGLPYLNFSYDFSGGGWSTSFGPVNNDDAVKAVPQQQSFSFAAFMPAASESNCVQISVVDSTGNNFGNCISLKSAEWLNVSVALVTASFWSNGRNLTLPVKGLSLGVGNQKAPGPGGSGWIGFADVAISSGAAPGDISTPIFHLLVQPRPDTAGVLVAGGADATVGLGVRVVNRLPVACTADVTVEMRNATGPLGGGAGGFEAWSPCGSLAGVPLRPWQTVPLMCTIDPAASPAGWVVMRSTFTGAGCWTANDTGPRVLEGGIVLALPQPAVAIQPRNVNPGVFGGQMFPNDAAASVIGMRSVRAGPLWEWNQPNECWNLSTCFDWGFYDGIFASAAHGIEVMIDARELPPPWARARNDSGGAWSEIPGPEHYADYQRWLSIMLGRYGPHATAVEVSNENDGYAYFANDKLPLNYTISLSAALVNITAAAIAQTPNASGLALMGLSSSLFDVMQCGNGGTEYLQYERAVLAEPGFLAKLSAATFHPYAPGVWVPWQVQSWGNTTFFFPNQTGTGVNSTVTAIGIMAGAMREAAQAAGLGPDYTPVMHPSEFGYNLLMRNAAGSGWTVMHAALIAHLLVHMRSAPVAQYVRKAYLFAAYDGCCAESDGYFGIWRPALLRVGAGAQGDMDPVGWLPNIVPLAGAAAYATASALLDVPSGRLPGVFVVDHSNGGADPPYLPSCVAFELDPASPLQPPPLVVLMTTAHHYNDALAASLLVATAAAPSAVAARARNGLGAPLPLAASAAPGGVQLNLTVGALPQYIELPADATATAVCRTLAWQLA